MNFFEIFIFGAFVVMIPIINRRIATVWTIYKLFKGHNAQPQWAVCSVPILMMPNLKENNELGGYN